MALSRIRCSKDVTTVLSRYTHPAIGYSGETTGNRHGLDNAKPAKPVTKFKSLHVSGLRRYPQAPRLPLPNNVSDIFNNETGRFTHERARDIAAPVLAYATSVDGRVQSQTKLGFEANSGNWGPSRASCGDNHVDSYDCFGAVSLNSSMQSNVPMPFCSSGKASHFNMPGGQWAQDSKYIAEDMQKSHYKSVKIRELERKLRGNGLLTNAITVILTPLSRSTNASFVSYSTDSSVATKKTTKKISETVVGKKNGVAATGKGHISNAKKLQKAVKDYGATVFVFHIGMSLMSLGACYVAISSGIDVGAIVRQISSGAGESIENAMANSSTFLIAYAVHKIFAPIRVSITLAAAPFIVRYLRNIGFIKMPKT